MTLIAAASCPPPLLPCAKLLVSRNSISEERAESELWKCAVTNTLCAESQQRLAPPTQLGLTSLCSQWMVYQATGPGHFPSGIDRVRISLGGLSTVATGVNGRMPKLGSLVGVKSDSREKMGHLVWRISPSSLTPNLLTFHTLLILISRENVQQLPAPTPFVLPL